MTVSRSDIAAYLATQFSALAASIGQTTNDDSATGYKSDIDAALRKFGVARADLATATVADGDEETVEALAEYYALRRFWRQLGDRVDNTRNQSSDKFGVQLDNVKAMLDDAQKRCAALGYDTAGEAWALGAYNADWIEPVVCW